MNRTHDSTLTAGAAALLLAALLPAANAGAAVPGISGTPGGTGGCPATVSRCFALTAAAGHITLGDGNSLLAWGYGEAAGGAMQYPGPVLLANQGDTVRVTLTSTLAAPTSIVFPGQVGVVAAGGSAGLLTQEVAAGGPAVSYTFKVTNAGTYLYQSGTQPELQIEMGLVGALIVRPAGFAEGTVASHPNRTAYGSAATAYDREFLFFLTEMDRTAHEAVELGQPVDSSQFKATVWFINGRNAPDTLLEPAVDWLPAQPYNAIARAHPGERVLMRIVSAGRDLHPFHHHGNNAWLVAQDGRVLESATGAAADYPDFQGRPTLPGIPELLARGAKLPDQAVSNYTIQSAPGNTYDALFTWTGFGLNWDIYGNLPGHEGASCNASTRIAGEDPNSHCKAFPVILPEQQSLTLGGMWSGSPYLGTVEVLPPLQGGLNPAGGYSYMWHSHTERELTNDDIFPGGMMTMMIIEAPNVNLD